MSPPCLNKQIGDEHHYIFKHTRSKFSLIRCFLTLFEAIYELADWNNYGSTHDLLLKILSDKTLSASPRISKLFYPFLETHSNIVQSQ